MNFPWKHKRAALDALDEGATATAQVHAILHLAQIIATVGEGAAVESDAEEKAA